MKVLLTTPLYSYDGNALKDGNGTLLLRSALLVALSQGNLQNSKGTYDEKEKQFSVGVKIATARDEVDLSANEIVMIKEIVNLVFSPLVVGQIGKLLEGQPTGIQIKVKDDKVEN